MSATAQSPASVTLLFPMGEPVVVKQPSDAQRIASALDWVKLLEEAADDLRHAPLTAQAHSLIARRIEARCERARKALEEIGK